MFPCHPSTEQKGFLTVKLWPNCSGSNPSSTLINCVKVIFFTASCCLKQSHSFSLLCLHSYNLRLHVPQPEYCIFHKTKQHVNRTVILPSRWDNDKFSKIRLPVCNYCHLPSALQDASEECCELHMVTVLNTYCTTCMDKTRRLMPY